MCKKEEYSYYSHKRLPEYDAFFYITTFLRDAFNYIQLKKLSTLQKLEVWFEDGMEFDNIDISIDHENNLVYLSEGWYDYKDKSTTPEIEELFEQGNLIKLCKMNFLKYITMTKNNFFNLILNWAQLVDKKAPYILIYLDDKDWYDSLPFDTQEAMEQFVADHTPK